MPDVILITIITISPTDGLKFGNGTTGTPAASSLRNLQYSISKPTVFFVLSATELERK